MALVLLAAGMWGTSGLLITVVVRDNQVSPLGLAFLRDLGTFACLLIGLGGFRRDLLRVLPADLPYLVAMGVIGIGAVHATWITSVVMNGVSVAAVIQQANTPIFVAVMSWVIWRERLAGRRIVAIGIAIVGTILVSRLDRLGGMSITLAGLAVGVASAITSGSFTLIGKKLAGDYSPWTILVYVFGFGTLVLLPFQSRGAFPWPIQWSELRYYVALVLFTTLFPYAIYTAGLRRLQASATVIVASAELPFAAIFSYLVLRERLDSWQVVGAALVLCGIVLISLPRQLRRRQPAEMKTDPHD